MVSSDYPKDAREYCEECNSWMPADRVTVYDYTTWDGPESIAVCRDCELRAEREAELEA